MYSKEEIQDASIEEIKDFLIELYDYINEVDYKLKQVIDLIPMKYKRIPSNRNDRLFFGRQNIKIDLEEFELAKKRMEELLKKYDES